MKSLHNKPHRTRPLLLLAGIELGSFRHPLCRLSMTVHHKPVDTTNEFQPLPHFLLIGIFSSPFTFRFGSCWKKMEACLFCVVIFVIKNEELFILWLIKGRSILLKGVRRVFPFAAQKRVWDMLLEQVSIKRVFTLLFIAWFFSFYLFLLKLKNSSKGFIVLIYFTYNKIRLIMLRDCSWAWFPHISLSPLMHSHPSYVISFIFY